MTFFTIIWILVVAYCFIKKSMKPMTYATLIFMTFQCANVIEMGGITVGPQVLTSFLFIVRYLGSTKGRLKIIRNKDLLITNILLLLLVAEIMCTSLLNDNFSGVFLNIVQLLVYILCYFSMRKCLNQYDDREIYVIIRNVIIFVVAIGVLQWTVTMDLLPIRSLLKPILYNDDSSNVYFNYNDHYHNVRVYAMFMEPSYLAGFLVGGFYYLFSFRAKWRSNALLMAVILIEILVSTSSTAYGALVVVGLFFVVYSKEIPRKWKLCIVLAAVAGFAILYFGFYDLLDAVIFSKSETGSGRTRRRWNLEALAAYNTSPIWGTGYKSVRGSSIIFSLLGELGTVGIIIYFALFFSILKGIFFRKKKANVSIGYYASLYSVFSVVICQCIACPDLDMCTLWLCMYVLALYEGRMASAKRRNLQYV